MTTTIKIDIMKDIFELEGVSKNYVKNNYNPTLDFIGFVDHEEKLVYYNSLESFYHEICHYLYKTKDEYFCDEFALKLIALEKINSSNFHKVRNLSWYNSIGTWN